DVADVQVVHRPVDVDARVVDVADAEVFHVDAAAVDIQAGVVHVVDIDRGLDAAGGHVHMDAAVIDMPDVDLPVGMVFIDVDVDVRVVRVVDGENAGHAARGDSVLELGDLETHGDLRESDS